MYSFQVATQRAPPSTASGAAPTRSMRINKNLGRRERGFSSWMSPPICMVSLRMGGPSFPHQGGGDLDSGGAHQDDEHAGEDEEDERDHDLHGGLRRAFLGVL